MQRALALARRGEGLTRPNPAVGAVVVRQGRVVGEGFHRKAGGPHAEVLALRRAGPRARGATLYVTLEPCSTWGRTPPCTEAILAAGIRRVVAAVRDPNPHHAGRGFAILRRRGVAVTEQIGAEEAADLLAPFATWITTGRPRVVLKLGQTLDGRIADARGRSRWITGPEARRQVQDLRRRSDAILVGRATAELDDPGLLPVPARGRCPWRVVLDSRGRLPLSHRIFTDGRARQTLVLTSAASSLRYRQRVTATGAEVVVVPRERGGGLRPAAVLQALGRRGVLQVLCEGGGRLAGRLLKQKLVDEAWIYVAPRLLGDGARPSVAGVRWGLAEDAGLRVTDCRMVGPDVLIKTVRKED